MRSKTLNSNCWWGQVLFFAFSQANVGKKQDLAPRDQDPTLFKSKKQDLIPII